MDKYLNLTMEKNTLKRIERLIRIKIKLTNDFFNIHIMAKENIGKIERCDKLIKELLQ